MSATKDWMMQVEEADCEEWIRERISDQNLDDSSEEWQLLEGEYYNEKSLFDDMAREQYLEMEWLEDNSFEDIYLTMISHLNEIQNDGQKNISEIFIKMKIAYGVTIMGVVLVR